MLHWLSLQTLKRESNLKSHKSRGVFMANKTSLLTKVAKGVAYGDVSNASIRNILTEISKRISGRLTEQEMYDTLEFFDWRCPYTGKDLKPLIENGLGGYAADHVYPQNRIWCGLNVKGNLIIVDKIANQQKRDFDVETFLLEDTSVITDIDEIGRTRQVRLEKIKEFQSLCGYDPDKIRLEISALLSKRYDALREEQEKCIDESLASLSKIGVATITKKIARTVSVSVTKSSTKGKTSTELVFFPADESEFRRQLLIRKKAKFVLTYDSGAVKETTWDAKDFEETSNLRGNIQSRPFWRNKKSEGLLRVEVLIDI